jgi:hypothetical protein
LVLPKLCATLDVCSVSGSKVAANTLDVSFEQGPPVVGLFDLFWVVVVGFVFC